MRVALIVFIVVSVSGPAAAQNNTQDNFQN